MLFGAGLTFNHFCVENGLQWDVDFGVCGVVAHDPDAIVGIALFQYCFKKDLHRFRLTGRNDHFGIGCGVRFFAIEFKRNASAIAR